MNTPLEWTTQQRRVNDLLPLEINPRKITEAQRMKMIESLQRFNLVDIPVIDTDETIISGHQRLRALQAIGRGDELVDCRVPNRKLTAKEIKEYNLLANSHFGEFDFEILSSDFGDVDFDLVPVDMGKIEFEQSDIFEQAEKKFEKEKAKAAQPVVEEDDFEVPDENTIETDIVPGDLFEIGPHRLLCGDSTNSDDVEKLMGGVFADLIVTDPPYGVAYVGKTADSLRIENDAMSEKQTHELWHNAIAAIWPFFKSGGSIYATVPARPLHLGFANVLIHFEALRQILVWNKSVFVMGRSDYHYKHEPILYGWKPGAAHYFIDDRTKTTVFDVDKPSANREHPTMKPIKLWEQFINNSSLINNVVYDCFLGSGTTMVAAHQLNRKCYGMEIGPKYCHVIINRMLKLDPTLTIKRNVLGLCEGRASRYESSNLAQCLIVAQMFNKLLMPCFCKTLVMGSTVFNTRF